jgi:hypothetical protein
MEQLLDPSLKKLTILNVAPNKKVYNFNKPEGCIASGYMYDKALGFTTKYLA